MAWHKSFGVATSFRVIDSLDAPHDGRILRLLLVAGHPPKLGALRNLEMVATSPWGRICRLRVVDFVVLGGKVRQARLNTTGRIDVRVKEIDTSGPIEIGWDLRPATTRERSRT